MVAQYNLYVDWENDGDFTGTGEDVSARVFSEGVRWERGRDQVRQLAPPVAGQLAATLDNASGDYSPENGSSPLAGNVEPGRELKLEAVSGGTSALWRGILDEPTVDAEGQSVGLRALGRLSKLQGVTISTDLYTDITTDQAFEYVCAAAGLASSEYSALDTGQTTLTAWWCAGDDALTMLNRILAAEGPGAAIYESAAGVITFHSRHYRLLTSRSTTSQVTASDTGTGVLHVSPYSYNRGRDSVVNSASLEVATLAIASVESDIQTFEIDPAVTLYPGDSVDIPIVLDAPADWEGTPGTFVSLPDLTLVDGTDAAYSATADRYSGQVATLTITSAATYRFTFSAVTLRGYATTTATRAVTNSIDTSTSQGKYGLRALPTSYDPWPYIDANVASDLCDAIVAAYQEPRAVVAITLENGTATELGHLLARDISDRITIVDSRSHVNADFFIERMAHEVGAMGQRHRATLGCEKAGSIDYAIWGTSEWGSDRWGF